jgi:hypothetical protein
MWGIGDILVSRHGSSYVKSSWYENSCLIVPSTTHALFFADVHIRHMLRQLTCYHTYTCGCGQPIATRSAIV